MPAPGQQISEAGAIYTVEAAFAAVMIIITLALIIHLQPADPAQDNDDLRILSGDVLNIMEYRSNLPGHPDLSHTIGSQADWDARSPVLDADVRSMLPPGTRFYLSTPFGDAGDVPPDYAPKYVQAFEAFSPERNAIVESKLILWRL